MVKVKSPGSGTVAPGQRATINDIARLAGVSKKTVSRVINQSPFVKEETRARIDAVIQQIGYTPDPQARGLAFRRSFLIGLVYDNPNAQYTVNSQEGVLGGPRKGPRTSGRPATAASGSSRAPSTIALRMSVRAGSWMRSRSAV